MQCNDESDNEKIADLLASPFAAFEARQGARYEKVASEKGNCSRGKYIVGVQVMLHRARDVLATWHDLSLVAYLARGITWN